jgi:hypothetical protein
MRYPPSEPHAAVRAWHTWFLRTAGEQARRLDENTLTRRRRRVLGEDHPDTLLSATNLAADL